MIAPIQGAKPGVLVSVRNETEAVIAFQAGVDILDIKEPTRGSLGRCDTVTIRQILDRTPPGQCLSVALGELHEWRGESAGEFLAACDALRRISFAKIGLAAQDDRWLKTWREQVQSFPVHVKPVAVAYVDRLNARSPEIREIVAAGLELGCRFILLDTFHKARGSLLDYISTDQLAKLLASNQELQWVLAGGIKLEVLQAITTSAACDFVGVRGAVCRAGSRESELCELRLRQFVDAVHAMGY